MDLLRQLESVARENRPRRYGYRLMQLRQLHTLLVKHRDLILKALIKDSNDSSDQNVTYDVIVDTVIRNGLSVYSLYRSRADASLSQVPMASVLICACRQDPLGSAVCPLAYAIAAGCSAAISPSPEAPQTMSILQDLFPQYMDREAYPVSAEQPAKLSQLAFALCVTTADAIEPPVSWPLSRSLFVRERGLNLICSLDKGLSALGQQRDLFALMLSGGVRQLRSFDAIIVLQNDLLRTMELAIRAPNGAKVRQGKLADLASSKRSFSAVTIIGVTSTEEALAGLRHLDINKLTYVGEVAYGSYLLKFMPHVRHATINAYDPLDLYDDLSTDPFTSPRALQVNTSPRVGARRTVHRHFPDFTVHYSPNINFFVQGFLLIKGMLSASAALSVTIAAILAWKRYG